MNFNNKVKSLLTSDTLSAHIASARYISYRNFLLLASAVALTACSSAHNHEAEDHDHEAETAEAGEHKHAGEIHFSEEQAQAAGLTLETVAPGEFSSVIRVGGQLKASTGDEQTLTAAAAGVLTPAVKNLCVGKQVRRGEVLYYITLGTTTEGDQVASARAELQAAKADFERAERLYKDQLLTARDYEQARLRYEQAQAATRGVSGSNGSGRIAVTAPSDGFVRALYAQNGSFVAVGQELATIAQNRKLQLQADVPERYADYLSQVSDARFRLSSSDEVYSVSALNGHLLAVAPSTDGTTPYLPVSFELEAQPGLRSGSYADVWLLGAKEQGVISVPTEALTEEQGIYYVYVQLDEDGYRQQEVSLGRNAGSRVEILSGLTPGDNVVVKAARQVKLASATGAIPGHTHNH